MAFTGRALYDPSGVFDGVAEDVSDIITMISPSETPLLNRLAPAPAAAMSVLHEWLEDKLNPNTVVTSNTALGLTDPVTLTVHDNGATAARFFHVGHIFEVAASGEQVQVISKADATSILVVSRGFGGTTIASIGAGATLDAISDAALEGADVDDDISRPRSRKTNYVQLIKKDVIVSGTVQAVRHLGGVNNEMDYQRSQRTREALRDLEKMVIRGRTSGATIGSSTDRRSMNGVLAQITTNVVSIGSLTPETLNDVVKVAWDNGGTDLDLIVCDSATKRIIDAFNDTRIDVANRDERFANKVSTFESTYGMQEVMLDRWMPTNTLMVISSQRIHAVPLTGRSFRFVPVSRTGDAEKGMIVGEYTTEVRNEEGMAQAGLV